MHKISIDASPSQLSKLRRGHRVRVRKGEGFNLLVHPETFHIATKSFSKNKGVQISLSPEEVSANREPTTAVTKEPILTVDDAPPAREGAGFHGIFKHKGSLGKSAAKAVLAGKLNSELGTNYDYMGRAGLANAMAHKASAAMSKLGIRSRKGLSPDEGDFSGEFDEPPSRGVSGGRLERSIVGRGGGMLHSYVPPALVSQPFSANFQMQHFLPPQYQHFEAGGEYDEYKTSGSGLYAGAAGRGLYA